MTEHPFDQIKQWDKDQSEAGDVTVSESALQTAIKHIRWEKEQAIIAEDYESAARWRDEEKQMMAATASGGLRRIIKED